MMNDPYAALYENRSCPSLRMLGTRPYVLIEFFDGGEHPDDLRAHVEGGAGLGHPDAVRAALRIALENLDDAEEANEAP
jgi:hypothetical protein